MVKLECEVRTELGFGGVMCCDCVYNGLMVVSYWGRLVYLVARMQMRVCMCMLPVVVVVSRCFLVFISRVSVEGFQGY